MSNENNMIDGTLSTKQKEVFDRETLYKILAGVAVVAWYVNGEIKDFDQRVKNLENQKPPVVELDRRLSTVETDNKKVFETLDKFIKDQDEKYKVMVDTSEALKSKVDAIAIAVDKRQ